MLPVIVVVLVRHCVIKNRGSQDSLLVERWTRDQKVVSSNPGRSSGRIFFSRVNFACWLLFSVRFTPVLPQWQVKDPGHSAKTAGALLMANLIVWSLDCLIYSLRMLMDVFFCGSCLQVSEKCLVGWLAVGSRQLCTTWWGVAVCGVPEMG